MWVKRKESYNGETNPEGRWRKFTYEEIIARCIFL
jgi:type I restriction enzyme M protein